MSVDRKMHILALLRYW